MLGIYEDRCLMNRFSLKKSCSCELIAIATGFLILHTVICAEAKQIVINNFNRMPVLSSPKNASRILIKKACTIEMVKTYHYSSSKNGSPGAGTIEIRTAGGDLVGQWKATLEKVLPEGEPEPVPAMWVCRPNLLILPGTYSISDSDPASWSCNQNSGMRGFYSVSIASKNEVASDVPTTSSESSLSDSGSLTLESKSSIPENMHMPADPAKIEYSHYVNPRFKYAIDYPSFLVAQAEPDNADGRTFQYQDMELKIYGTSLYSTVSGEAWTIPTLMADALRNKKEDGETVTYKKSSADWLVLSGYRGDQIFYLKAMIQGESVKCFEFRYPASSKKYFDPVISRLVGSFKNTE